MAEYTRVNFDNSTSSVDVTYDSSGVATVTQDVLEILLGTSGYYPSTEPEPEPEPPGTPEQQPS